MLRAGLEPPRVDWSPPRALSAPTAMRVFTLSSQQALKLNNSSLLPSGTSRSRVPGGTARGGRSGWGSGQRWAEQRPGRDPGSRPRAGGQCLGSALAGGGHGPWRGRCQRSCGAVPRGRAAAVPCLASPHLSGIRCSIAGNSQRIPALNCSRLSSFSQGLSRCVGDAG